MTTEKIFPSETDVLGCEERNTLVNWKMAVQERMAQLDQQLSDAKSRAWASGDYSDPKWFRQAERTRRELSLLMMKIDQRIAYLRMQRVSAVKVEAEVSADKKIEKWKLSSKRYGRLTEVLVEALGGEVSSRLRHEAESRAAGNAPQPVSGYRTEDIDALSEAHKFKTRTTELEARLSRIKSMIESERIPYQPNMPLSWYDARDQTNAALARILKFL